MKPKSIKAEITRIKEGMIEEDILIKAHLRYRDKENHNERITKQKEIIIEAEKAIATIRHDRTIALAKIAKIKQHMRWEKRRLAVLSNFEKIELLKKTINDLQTVRKETDDAKSHNDS